MAVVKGQAITAQEMNNKISSDQLIQFGKAIDAKLLENEKYTIFVGTDTQWSALPIAERNKYIMRGVPK